MRDRHKSRNSKQQIHPPNAAVGPSPDRRDPSGHGDEQNPDSQSSGAGLWAWLKAHDRPILSLTSIVTAVLVALSFVWSAWTTASSLDLTRRTLVLANAPKINISFSGLRDMHDQIERIANSSNLPSRLVFFVRIQNNGDTPALKVKAKIVARVGGAEYDGDWIHWEAPPGWSVGLPAEFNAPRGFDVRQSVRVENMPPSAINDVRTGTPMILKVVMEYSTLATPDFVIRQTACGQYAHVGNTDALPTSDVDVIESSLPCPWNEESTYQGKRK